MSNIFIHLITSDPLVAKVTFNNLAPISQKTCQIPILSFIHILREDGQDSLCTFLRDWSKSEKLSEIKPPLSIGPYRSLHRFWIKLPFTLHSATPNLSFSSDYYFTLQWCRNRGGQISPTYHYCPPHVFHLPASLLLDCERNQNAICCFFFCGYEDIQ